MAVKSYRAVASRDGKFWLVHVPALEQYTQARSLSEVEPMARDLFRLCSKSLRTRFKSSSRTSSQNPSCSTWSWHASTRARRRGIRQRPADERRFAAREMRAGGMTVRDVGDALGISHQRAQQLISHRPRREVASTPG